MSVTPARKSILMTSNSGSNHNLTGDAIRADSYYGRTDGIHTVQVVYSNSIYSKPPEDGKLRTLWPEYQWLHVSDQKLIPIDAPDIDPITYNTIYSTE